MKKIIFSYFIFSIFTVISLISAADIKKGRLAAFSICKAKNDQKISYVIDGLVSMYDAEHNVGFNMHDEESNVWVDLISNLQTQIPNSMKFNGNEAQFLANGIIDWNMPQELKDALTSANMTIEICLKIIPYNHIGYRTIFRTTDENNNINYIYIYTPRSSSSTQTYIFYNYYGRASSIDNILDEYGNFTGTIALTCSSQSMMGKRYTNGTISSRASFNAIPTSAPNKLQTLLMTNASIYCIRIYSRPLTDSEIKHNYNIDKERFNLQ